MGEGWVNLSQWEAIALPRATDCLGETGHNIFSVPHKYSNKCSHGSTLVVIGGFFFL